MDGLVFTSDANTGKSKHKRKSFMSSEHERDTSTRKGKIYACVGHLHGEISTF